MQAALQHLASCVGRVFRNRMGTPEQPPRFPSLASSAGYVTLSGRVSVTGSETTTGLYLYRSVRNIAPHDASPARDLTATSLRRDLLLRVVEDLIHGHGVPCPAPLGGDVLRIETSSDCRV